VCSPPLRRFEYSEAILSAKRGSDYTEEELIEGGRDPVVSVHRNGLKPTLRVQPPSPQNPPTPLRWLIRSGCSIPRPSCGRRRSPPFAGA